MTRKRPEEYTRQVVRLGCAHEAGLRVSYTTLANDTAGGQLQILLLAGWVNDGSGAVQQAQVDNIRFSAAAAGGFAAMSGSAAAVPEPGTFALLASGLLGLVAYAWRKRS